MSPVKLGARVGGVWRPIVAGGSSVTPPPPPNDGYSPTRKTGTKYVTYESTYVSGDDLQDTINRVTGGRVLTFPPGEFIIPPDFSKGFTDGVRFAHSSATQGAGCKGLSGSGSRGPNATTFKMLSSNKPQPNYANGVANNYFLINGTTSAANNAPRASGLELSQFHLEGTLLGADHDHNGLRYDYVTNSLIEDVRVTGIKGSGKIPPRETGSISFNRTDNITVNDFELDGRRISTGGERVSSALLMPNSSQFINVNRGYLHHTRYGGGGIAWFGTSDGLVVDTRSEYIGSGAADFQAYCFNHEQSTRIKYINPVMIADRQSKGANNFHFSINADLNRGGVDSVITFVNPTWDDTGFGQGLLVGETWELTDPDTGATLQMQRRPADVWADFEGGTRLAHYYVNPYIGSGVR